MNAGSLRLRYNAAGAGDNRESAGGGILVLMFRDRSDAGRALAGLLSGYRGRGETVLLALPRGGVPVAGVMARELGLPLDVLGVHKVGAPGQPEYAIGAVAAGGLVVWNEEAIAAMHLGQAELDAAVEREREELARRERLYREGRAPFALAGWTVVLVDDGLATGYTMLAAVRAVRQAQAARVVVAVPVAPAETIAVLRGEADEVVCALTPDRLFAVGQFYEDFSQVTDEEVRGWMGGTPPGGIWE